MPFTEVFGGSSIYPSDATYIALAIAVDVALSWPIEQQIGGNLIVADIIDLTASAGGLSVTIPDARNATEGFTALFNNVGANTVTIRNASGASIVNVAPGSAWQIYLTDNSTEAGVWRSFQYGASLSVVSAAALAGNGLINIGVALSLNLDVTSVNVTPHALDANSRARLFNWISGTAIFTLPDAVTLGDGWITFVRNSGSGNITLTPSSGTIDGAATKVIVPGGSVIIVSDGTNYITLVASGGGSGGATFNLLPIDVSGGGDYTISGAQLDQVGYKLTGVLSANRNLIVPGTIAQYWVDNETTGAFTLTVKTAAGTGIVVPQGARNILYSDGTNVVSAESAAISFPVAVVQGGTGATTAAGAQTNLAVPPNTRLIATGTGLTGGGSLAADRSLSLSFLGMQALSDPNVDRIMFWDDSAGAMAWLEAGSGLAIAGTVLTATGAPTTGSQAITIKTSGGVQVATGTAYWTIIGNMIYLTLRTFQWSGDAATVYYVEGLPAAVVPSNSVGTTISCGHCHIVNNGSGEPGFMYYSESLAKFVLTTDSNASWSSGLGVKGIGVSNNDQVTFCYHKDL